jgi:hypothetical protein
MVAQENMREYWDRRKADIKLMQESGRVVFIRNHKRLQVIAPQNKDFIKGAEELAGRFKRKTQVWSFDARLEKKVRELVEQVWPGQGFNRTQARFQSVTEES